MSVLVSPSVSLLANTLSWCETFVMICYTIYPLLLLGWRFAFILRLFNSATDFETLSTVGQFHGTSFSYEWLYEEGWVLEPHIFRLTYSVYIREIFFLGRGEMCLWSDGDRQSRWSFDRSVLRIGLEKSLQTLPHIPPTRYFGATTLPYIAGVSAYCYAIHSL